MKWIPPVVLVAVLTSSSVETQTQSQPPSVKATTAGVLIDVSVVDNKGQSVLDLTPADFELSEDGKKQQLVSVILVNGGVAKPVGNANAPLAPAERVAPPSTERATAPENTPTVTAILFDKLSGDAAPYAVRAALAYVETLTPSHDYAAVFVADLNLRILEPFTNDQSRLRGAVERFGATARTNMRPETQRAGDDLIRIMDPNTPPTASAESPGGFASVAERENALKAIAQNDPARYKMMQMMWRMETSFRQMLTEYEGHSSMAGLRTVVDALGPVAGRKSILYFTENLPITDRLKTRFEAVIGHANRSNITFYPIDAAGLRLHSKEAEVARNVNLAGAQGIGDAQREDGAWTKELERQSQLVESRPAASLGRLAKETGGFLIDNTNDLGAGVARMRQERTTYYLLGYQPTNVTMDGKFRRVSVKVKRSKVSVRARPGYLAVPQESR